MNAPCLSLISCLVLGPPAAPADGVDDAIAAAQAHAAAGDFDRALLTVREARRALDDPALLFVEAQVLRMRGDCSAARVRYQQFLERDAPPEDHAVARAGIEACRPDPEVPASAAVPDASAAVPDATDATDATAGPRPSDPTTPPRDVSREPLRRDPAGLGLWISGSIALAGGIGVYGGAWATRSRSQRGEPALDEYLDRERRARTLSGVGIASMSIGASILVTATVRHIIMTRQRRSGRGLSSRRRSHGTTR